MQEGSGQEGLPVHSREFCPWRNCPLVDHQARHRRIEDVKAAMAEIAIARRLTA